MIKKHFNCCFLNDTKNCRSNLNNCGPPPQKIKNSKHMIKLTNTCIILNSFAGTTSKCLSTTKAEFGIQWFKTPDSHLT